MPTHHLAHAPEHKIYLTSFFSDAAGRGEAQRGAAKRAKRGGVRRGAAGRGGARLVALSAEQRERGRGARERERRGGAGEEELLLALGEREDGDVALQSELAQNAARRRELRLATVDQQAVWPCPPRTAQPRAQSLGDGGRVVGGPGALDPWRAE